MEQHNQWFLMNFSKEKKYILIVDICCDKFWFILRYCLLILDCKECGPGKMSLPILKKARPETVQKSFEVMTTMQDTFNSYHDFKRNKKIL